MGRIIDEDMTLTEVEHELRTRGVTLVEVVFDKGCCLAKAQLCALRGPEGWASSALLEGATLAKALDNVCLELDEATRREICVYIGQTLLGRYPNTAVGRQYAKQHVASADHVASAGSGVYRTVFPKST